MVALLFLIYLLCSNEMFNIVYLIHILSGYESALDHSGARQVSMCLCYSKCCTLLNNIFFPLSVH